MTYRNVSETLDVGARDLRGAASGSISSHRSHVVLQDIYLAHVDADVLHASPGAGPDEVGVLERATMVHYGRHI